MAFKSLVSAVSEHCQEIRETLSSFSYFDKWDDHTIVECCRLSFLEEFPPKEVILGSSAGSPQMVYFIVDGVCRMIDYLQLEAKRNSKGERKYTLYKSFAERMNSEVASSGFTSLLFSENESKRETQPDLGLEKINQEDYGIMKTKIEEIDELPEADISAETESCRSSIVKNKERESLKVQSKEEKKEVIYDEDYPMKVLLQCQKKLQGLIRVTKKETIPEIPQNVKGYFMQIGFLYKGGCFGLEKFTDKHFVLSETNVKCLKIPRKFLFHHNPCNVWNRILLFDSLYLPTEETVLECLKTDRKWMKWKKKLTKEIVSRKGIANYTTISDVPYSIRLTDLR